MATIDSFTPPHGTDKRLDSLTESTVNKRQVQAEDGGVSMDDIKDKSNKGGDNNEAA